MAQQPEKLSSDEVEKLLRTGSAPTASPTAAKAPQVDKSAAKASAAAAGAAEAATPTLTEPLAAPRKRTEQEHPLPAGDVEFLLKQAEEALASVDAPRAESAPGLAAFRFEEFGGAPASTETATLDLIRDVELDVRIELGRTQMYLEDVLRLRRGSVVALDKLAGDPVDIYVNGRLVARGEVLVLNENFCVRVNELLAAQSARAG
jgi:flagellar motor switch protein FliN/FliY